MPSINMRFPKGLKKAVTLSYDDGVASDVRLMEICKAHGLKITFNINSGCFAPEGSEYREDDIYCRMTKSDCVKLYKDSGMEVAVHGLTHSAFTNLAPAARAREVSEDKVNLEKIFDQTMVGGAYPYGAYDEASLDILTQCGLGYYRTVTSTHDFNIPRDFRALDPTCHHADPELDTLVDRFLNQTEIYDPLMFYLWGHSYEFRRDNNWEIIEKFAKKIGGHSDIWYATNAEIYNYVQLYKRLVWRSDLSKVFNPTYMPIFVQVEDNILEIKPGETVETKVTC